MDTTPHRSRAYFTPGLAFGGLRLSKDMRDMPHRATEFIEAMIGKRCHVTTYNAIVHMANLIGANTHTYYLQGETRPMSTSIEAKIYEATEGSDVIVIANNDTHER